MAPPDVAVVTELGIQLGYPVDEAGIARRLERYGGTDAHLLLVAERDGEIVGSGITPSAVYEKKCETCSLLPVCLPRATEAGRSARAFFRH